MLAEAAEAMQERITTSVTMKRLVSDLEPYEKVRGVKALIKKAQKNYYDDFGSPLAFPMLNLRMKCERLGLHTIAKNVVDGKYES